MTMRSLDSPDVINGRVCRDGNMERREVNIGGGAAMIIDYSTGAVIQLIPHMRAYRQVDATSGPFAELLGPANNGNLEVSKSGSETVNGMKTTVYDIAAVDQDGTATEGRVWVNADSILIKAEGRAMENGQQMGGGYELSNLVTGPHDGAIYSIPADYEEMQLGFGGQMPLDDGSGDAPAPLPGLPDANTLAETLRKQGVPAAQVEQMLQQMESIKEQLGQ